MENVTFAYIAKKLTDAVGSPWATLSAIAIVVLWSIGGIFFGFSDSYQMYINTGTTIVTFIMVFIVQATQNRHEQAIQTKIDELLRAVPQADNHFRGIEKDDCPLEGE